MNFLIIFIICLPSMLTLAFARPHEKPPKKYAVLVATTKSWEYYRHQSTILHAYHTLLSNGVPKENIITMFYDDIAHHPQNFEAGVIRNHPFGPNLYTKNLTKSYTGNAVNAKNLLAVLTGNENVASGPVIKSGPRDTIFVYISGIGTYRAITFPYGPSLPADKFVEALKQVRSKKNAKKIFVMLDVAFAASLVHGIVPRHDKIIVSTATHFKELPSAVYCYLAKKICYATLYGAAWTQHSDRLRQMRLGQRETLFDQFSRVRTLTVNSHVGLYGEVEMGQSRLKEFIAYRQERKSTSVEDDMAETVWQSKNRTDTSVDEDDEGQEFSALDEYSSRNKEEGNLSSLLMVAEKGGRSLNIMNEFNILPAFTSEKADILVKRKFVQETFERVLQKLDVDFHSIGEPSVDDISPEVFRDYEKSIEAFNSTCININENMYVLQFLGALAKICEMRIPLEKQFAAMQSVCTEGHRQLTFVH